MLTLEKLPYSKYTVDDLCEISLGKHHLEINVKEGIYKGKDVRKIVNTLNELANGKQYLVQVNCEPGAMITFGGLRALGSATAMKYATAKAYVLNTRHQRIMGEVFLAVFRPETPVNFFDTREQAREWLDNHVVVI